MKKILILILLTIQSLVFAIDKEHTCNKACKEKGKCVVVHGEKGHACTNDCKTKKSHTCTSSCRNESHDFKHGEKEHACTKACKQ